MVAGGGNDQRLLRPLQIGFDRHSGRLFQLWTLSRWALVGVGIGGAFHAVSHVIGIDLGGRPAIDIPVFGGLALVLLVAGPMRWRGRRA